MYCTLRPALGFCGQPEKKKKGIVMTLAKAKVRAMMAIPRFCSFNFFTMMPPIMFPQIALGMTMTPGTEIKG